MAVDFHHTIRSLQLDDGAPGRYGLLVAVGLLAAWLLWATVIRLALFEVSEHARIEVQAQPQALKAPLAGRLVMMQLAAGQKVAAGTILCEIDSAVARHRLAEQQAALVGLDGQIAALGRELALLARLLRTDLRAVVLAGEAASARARAAAERSELAADQARRNRSLAGQIAELEVIRSQIESAAQKAAQQSLVAEAQRAKLESAVTRQKSSVRVATAYRELAALLGQRATLRAALATSEAEVERHRVRAAVAGLIGEVAPLAAGAYVEEGAPLGVLLPEGPLHVVAQVRPAAAFGRIAPGQRAWLRLDGFPWTQYGRLPLQVTSRADEVRGGLVRVTLRILPSSFAVPLAHGMPGRADIEVERVAPLTLLLRSIGRLGPGSDSLGAAEQP
jgi:membrane fusion protein (multidrug efflux system)